MQQNILEKNKVFWGLIKFQWLVIFCLYTLPLVRPAQTKIQMMTTSNWIVTIPSKSFLKSLGLYKFFLDDQNYFLMLEIKLKIKFLEIFSTCQDISPGDKILHMQVRKAKVM